MGREIRHDVTDLRRSRRLVVVGLVLTAGALLALWAWQQLATGTRYAEDLADVIDLFGSNDQDTGAQLAAVIPLHTVRG